MVLAENDRFSSCQRVLVGTRVRSFPQQSPLGLNPTQGPLLHAMPSLLPVLSLLTVSVNKSRKELNKEGEDGTLTEPDVNRDSVIGCLSVCECASVSVCVLL